MRGGVFLGGEAPPANIGIEIIGPLDISIAADSGLHTAEALGYDVDWIVGDMDSLDSEDRLKKYRPEKILRFPREKDETDGEIATRLLQSYCQDISLIGGGGGRLDHSLAILAMFQRDPPPWRWINAKELGYCLDPKLAYSELSVRTIPGTVISVFPLGSGPWAIQSVGLKWKLKDVNWAWNVFSLSNEANAKDVELIVESGRFIAFFNY